jgi:radical SAM superfamily enzyme YgiQ (UPF0313 family)
MLAWLPRAAAFRNILRPFPSAGPNPARACATPAPGPTRKRVLVVGTHLRRDRSKRSSRDPLQPMTGLHIASLVDPARYDVDLHHEDWHGPYDTRRASQYSVVFLTGLHADFDRMRQLSYHFRRRGAVVVAGGNFCTLFPEFAARFFDAVCVGGVESVADVMRDFADGRLRRIYRSSPVLRAEHRVDYRLLWRCGLRLPVHLVESSRGCSFRCRFCVLPAEGARHAPYALDAVDAAIDSAIAASPRFSIARLYPTVWFLDNNFSDSREHLHAMCERLARHPKVRAWGALVTQNILHDRALMQHLARHGCRAVFTGLESLDAAFLKQQNKKQNLAHGESVIEDVLYAEGLGICVMYAYLFDPRQATAETMRQQIRALAATRGFPLPAFVSMLIPLAGTADFWDSARRGELRPNLRLRELDGETIAYARPADTDENLTRFMQELSTAPTRLLGRLRILRSTIARIRSSRSLNPLYWYLLYASNFRFVDFAREYDRAARRNYLGGSDALDAQYDEFPADISAADRVLYFDPIRVTDAQGRVADWLAAKAPKADAATPLRPAPNARTLDEAPLES